MSEKIVPDYSVVAVELKSAGLSVRPAELQGLLIGMISGGLSITDKSWQALIFDYTNDGMGWQDNALRVGTEIFKAAVTELTGSEIELSMLLADDNEPLQEQADSLSEWVNHFISGLGLAGLTLKDAPKDVKEALGDLEEISKLGIDEDDDMQEQADLLEQVIEHVKACVLTVHAEYGLKVSSEKSAPTIH
ncbi:UPF0149 protein [Vibrio sp. MACH09]|uniref:YecA/YgfB family protein n=1 Tax=Vibrio sp. MACH09 TaxID=3025122 RepID=UPI002793B85B|nr:YecA family protein [Vibrio sp. MACH09]GLO59892.1 UPF0149 protein [Vibrio sp. MACH09]